jgi:hypothetical protein
MAHDRIGGTAADVQDEILKAACVALDKAYYLLDYVVKYDGKCTPEFVAACREWVDGEYDPGERQPKACQHNWAKTVLDNTMYCTRCGVERSVGCQ